MLTHHQPLRVPGCHIEGVFGCAVTAVIVIVVVLLRLGGVDDGDGAVPRIVVDTAADHHGLPLPDIHDELLADPALDAEIAAGGQHDVMLGIAVHIVAAAALCHCGVDGLHSAGNGCLGGVILQGGLQPRQLVVLLLLLVFQRGHLHLQLLDAGGIYLSFRRVLIGVEEQLMDLLFQTLDVLFIQLHVQLRLLDVQLDGIGVVAEQGLSLRDGVPLFYQQLLHLFPVLRIHRHALLRLHHACKQRGSRCRGHIQLCHMLDIDAAAVIAAALQIAPAKEGCHAQQHHGADDDDYGFLLHGDTSVRDRYKVECINSLSTVGLMITRYSI